MTNSPRTDSHIYRKRHEKSPCLAIPRVLIDPQAKAPTDLLVGQLLDDDPFRRIIVTAQATELRGKLCAYIRARHSELPLSSNDDDILSPRVVQLALDRMATVRPTLNNGIYERTFFVPNPDPKTIGAEPLIAITSTDTVDRPEELAAFTAAKAAFEKAGDEGEKKRLQAEMAELSRKASDKTNSISPAMCVDAELFLLGYALDPVGNHNIRNSWTGALSAADPVVTPKDDDTLAMAENSSPCRNRRRGVEGDERKDL